VHTIPSRWSRLGKCDSDVGEMKMMRLTVTVLALLLVFTAGCRKDDVPITQVKVWDKNFQVIRTITNATTLASLKQVWEDRSPVSVRPKFTHKVDVATSDGSVRWLYDPDGYARGLGIKASVPIYQVREPDKLREILIPQQPDGAVTHESAPSVAP
jgi:hypothetical protein